MSEYEHDKIVPYAASHAAKKEQVATMFDHIAKRYDFLNRFLSLGIDQGWRKKAIGYFGQQKINHLLDIATGTADMALMADKTIAPHKITGIDISEGMMQYGRIKIADKGLSDRIQLITGDSTAIPFEDQTFDAAMVAFGVRNFAKLEKGLSEIYRLLQPGSKLVILEFSQPSSFWFKPIYQFYMNWVTPTIGKLFSGNRAAYQYLNDSVIAFPEGAAFIKIFEQVGFKQVIQKKEVFQFNKLKTEFVSASREDFLGSGLFYSLLFAPLLLIPIVMIARKQKEAKDADVVGNRVRNNNKLVKKYLSEAKKQMGDKVPFYMAMEKALHNFLKAKLHIETVEMSKDNIIELLQKRNASEQSISQFMELMNDCEFARYAPATDIAMTNDFERAVERISELEKQLK